MEIMTKEVARMRDPRAGGGGDSFYAQSGGRPAFNPGNASPFSIPRTEAVPKRVGRNPVTTLVTWATVLVVAAIGVKYGYPVVMEKVHAKEIAGVTADLNGVAAAEESYFKLSGTYGTTFDSLSIPKTINRISVVSASSSAYCLKGEGVAGGVTLYYSRNLGLSDKACG